MSPYYSDNFASVFRAKAEQFLPTLPDKSVNLIATDPPFCGVKDEDERCCRVTADRLRQGILFASEPVAEAG
jgi:DNA modification methylase